VLDHEVRTVRDGVYLPLYPLAEWIVSNWWRLLFEIESSERLKDPLYERRHNFRWAREGYSVPPLELRPLGELLLIKWESEVLPHHRVKFLEAGTAYLSLEEARHALRQFVTSVAERLNSSNITGTFLQREWDVITSTDRAETDFCVASATLGLDPYDIDDSVATGIVTVAESMPASVRREFFSVASQAALREESVAVNAGIEQLRGNRADLRELRALRNSVAQSGTNGHEPWQEGYAAARSLRSDLHAGLRPIPTFKELAEVLRVSAAEFSEAIIDRPDGTRAYEAIVAMNRSDSPAFTIGRRSDTARRFQVCRGLYDFLSGRDDGPWLVTTGLSDRQKRNRAFAAEFLAPAAGIRERVKSRIVSGAEVDELAQYFGVSSDAIVHQLGNHEIASVAW
jgi:Zn-dependent peptidase ImmA (M78 family)